MANMTNKEIAKLFFTVADLLQLKGESIHRVLAYRRAAETIEEQTQDLRTISEAGTLTDLPSIGKTLADKIEELLNTGELEFYNRLTAEVPLGLIDIMNVPGVGPKKAKLFWEELDITELAALKEAAENGELQKLSGMGKKSEAKVLEGIEMLERRTDRVRIGDAWPLAERMLQELRDVKGVEQIEIGGSLRRRRETIGDIDLLVASDDTEAIMDAFVELPDVAKVMLRGETKTSVELRNGQQADLRVAPANQWGTLLVYFTGSQNHNVKMRELARERGLTLNEYRYSHIDGEGDDIFCETEEAVYKVLDLPWIAPELREDRGEYDAAINGSLPSLIRVEDIKGDLQLHTTWSDGKTSVLEMAKAAMAQGREYMLVTDHSFGLGMVNGVKPEDIEKQRAEINEANAKLGDAFHVLHGTECEIKADGSLDFSDDQLAMFDVVLASMHTSLRQPRDQVTERLIKAIRNPYVRIIGHPRGRLIPEREPADLDMEAIFKAAVEEDVAMEINANPHRLDLDAAHARRAIELGVKLTISTDAHEPDHFAFMQYGVWTARRGWVETKHVMNTRSLDEFLAWARP